MKRYLLLGAIVLALGLGIVDFLERTRELHDGLVARHEVVQTKVSVASPSLPVPRSLLSDSRAKIFAKTPLEMADSFLADHRAEWNIQPHHQFRATVMESPLGATVTYNVFQGELPIDGIQIEIRTDRQGQIQGYQNGYRPVKRLEVGAGDRLTPREAGELLSERYKIESEAAESTHLAIHVGRDEDHPELVYWMSVRDRVRKLPVQVMVRASDGQVLQRTVARSER